MAISSRSRTMARAPMGLFAAPPEMSSGSPSWSRRTIFGRRSGWLDVFGEDARQAAPFLAAPGALELTTDESIRRVARAL